MSSSSTSESANAVSRRSWGRVVAFAIVAILLASVIGILLTPALAGRPSIGLPDATPEYMKFITVNNYRFDPLAEMPSIPAGLRYDSIPRNQEFYYLVQFKGPVTPAMKNALRATGVTILDYINYNAFIVRGDGTAMDRAASLPVVRWTGVFQPAYKLSPRLSDEYGAIVQAALERAQRGEDTATGVVTAVGGSMPAKSVRVDSFGGPTSASFASGFSPRATATTPGASPGITPGTSFGGPTPDPKMITIQLSAFEPSRVPEVLRAASFLGGKQIAYTLKQSGAVQVEVDKAALSLLARVPGVMLIDRTVRPYVFNDLARWVIQSGDVDTFATPVHDNGIWGTGQTVTLGDTGIDFKHPAFWDPGNTTPGPDARKVTDYYPGCSDNCDGVDNGINHGTHTAGSVGGDDGTWHVYDGTPDGGNGAAGPHDGQAFDAKLQMQDLSNDGFFVYFDSIVGLWRMAQDRDSWIHSNSWGSCCSTYINETADTDEYIWTNQDFLVVFAAGNAGSGLNSMNPFAGAKNVIAVGATSNGLGLENVASFSSRGPMADGRLKPDVMAPGVSVWSAEGLDPGGDGTGYFQLSGTSMATPTVSGGAALVRQYYMDGWYPTGASESANAFTPSAALIKATLINGAVEMTGSGAYGNGQNYYPNDNQGWGRILLDNGLFFTGDSRGLVVDDHRAGINTDDVVSYAIAIGDASLPVEITLVWSDFKGNPATTPNLVNDLDLTVIAQDGTIFRGNQYAGANPGESVPDPADRDSLNNVESVLVITGVQSGLWTVEVSGFNIPQGPQTFAIVMTGGVATNRGSVQLDSERYQSSATVNIKVVDTGPNVDPGNPDTVDVSVTSDTETTPEVLTLTETAPASSVFEGSIDLENAAPVDDDGLLQVAEGDTITVQYDDADDGLGGSGPVYDTAVVDDTAPLISGVAATNLRFNRATIVWTTDEPSDSVLSYGDSPPPANTKSTSRLETAHSVTITGLTEETTYYYAVQSTDKAGNTALDDNGGAYYTFTTPPKPPTAPPSEEWPQFHNNPPRQGISPSNFEPPIDRMWSDGPFLINRWNGPVFADGILFSAPLDGTLRARDPYSGEVLWERTLGDDFYFTGTMAASGGVLYATFYGNAGGHVYALDEFTGETTWVVGQAEASLDFNARIMMGFSDDLVFGSAWGGEIYALNAADGSVEWTYQTGQLPFGGPTVNAGLVYMGTTDGSVFAIDEFSGGLVWSRTLDSTVTSSPLYAQGNIYVGSYGGIMYALDAFTGEDVWSSSGFGMIDVSTPAYDGTSIYFGSFNSEYIALDSTDGSILWRTAIGGPVGTSPAYANGFVYGTSWDSTLYVFDSVDGSIVDTESMTAFGSTSFPAVSDGWVWLEDNDGNIYAFFGQLPVGLIVQPSRARQETVPDSTVDYALRVTNVGVSGPDTFDATVALGGLGWTVDLYQADGTTPLADTDSDAIPDTGLLATDESAVVVARVTVPLTVAPGDADTAIVTFTSSNAAKSKSSHLTTIVPPPGVKVGPRAYFAPNPGDTVAATMDVANTGGFDDTIDVTASSSLGWTLRLFEADGTTPLSDSDGDSIPDVGLVPGLSFATIAVEVDVPQLAPPDTLQVAAVTGTSSLDTGVSATGFIVVELIAPPDELWPTFHNNMKRAGESPSAHEPPMTEHWRSSPNLQHVWTGPVVADGLLYSTTLDGFIRARDPWSGGVVWEQGLGGSFFFTGTPVIANQVVYATFYTDSGGTVYALDGADGSILWATDQGDTGLDFNARVAMTYAEGLVIGAAWGDFINGQVYALDADTGAFVWSADASGLPFGGGSVGLGTVFYGTTQGQILALDLPTGATRWTTMLDGTVTSPPLFAQGNLFVGTYAGTMYALDALTGSVVWSTGGFRLIDFSTPAYDGTSLYFGDFNAEYVSLDVATGAVNWRTSIPSVVGSSVAYANGFVYGTSQDGVFRTLNAKTGAIVDEDDLAGFASMSMPAVSRGWVWVEDIDGRIYGFGGVGAGEIRQVLVSPGAAEMEVGTAALFRAGGVDAFDNPIPVTGASWSSLGRKGTVIPISEDTAVYVAGVDAGADTLQATAGGFAGSASITLLPGPIDHIGVKPVFLNIAAGTSTTFGASGEDRFGNPIPGGSFTWAVTGGIGTITSSGAFTASTAVGVGTVTATAGGKTGTAIVAIVPAAAANVELDIAGGTLQADSLTTIGGTVRDSFGNVVLSGEIQWSVTGGTIVRIMPDGRFVLYNAPISTTPPTQRITATTAGGVSTSVTVTISAGPPVGIVVDAPATAVASGGSIDFDAIVTDQFGNRVTGATIAWKTTGGTINQDGVLTAPSQPGIVIVTASTAGRESSVMVEVIAGALDQFSRQATSATSLIFLVVAVIAIAASVFMFVHYRESRRELEEMRKGGGGGAGGGG